jgi:K+-sensing histidine kinase KdpD
MPRAHPPAWTTRRAADRRLRDVLDPVARGRRVPRRTVLSIGLAVALPLVVGALLAPVRDDLLASGVALALMLTVVVAAAGGGRLPGVVAALAAAVSYHLLRAGSFPSLHPVTRDDIQVAAFLLVAGVVVGTVARQSQRAHASAKLGRSQVRRIHRLAEQVSTGEDPADVILTAEAELTALLDLRACRFEAPPYGTTVPVRLERGAAPSEPRRPRGSGGSDALPADGAELPVLSRGQPVGRFVLVPCLGRELSLEERVVAVALADQVGAALATAKARNERSDRGHA